MALDPGEAELLRNIYREVGETKVLVEALGDTVAIHSAALVPLQAGVPANNFKHKVAIFLGVSGVGAGSLGAAEPGWLASILRLWSG